MDLHENHILESDNAEACFKLGVQFMENSQYAEAETCFRRTLSLAPGSLETILNLGHVLDKQGRSAEALACYESVLAAAPDNPKARYNRAIHLLRSGELAAGFADYEARFAALSNADNRLYSQPRWDGSRLDGRSILIYCEQGLGDAIQFSRYVPRVARLGGRVVLEAQPSLVSLLSTLPGVDSVVVKSGVPPLTDCHIPLLSLPFIFGTTSDAVPGQIPYLVPDGSKTEFWRQMLAADTQYKVGIVWRGSATNPMDRDRSCPVAEFAPLLEISGVSCYNLQVDSTSDEMTALSRDSGLIDLAGHLVDFSDTAALVVNLDLVISVDTAVAHLAGALGKPVWNLLAHTPDWRWMLGRNDSPWYPTMRLFRQPQPGDWEPVIREVAQALQQQLLSQENGPEFFPGLLERSFQQALAALESNDPDTAIHILQGILPEVPDDPAVWFNLGRAYDLAGEIAEAEHAYRQALSVNPDSPAIWFALGEIRMKQHAYPEAEFCLGKAHLLKPDSVEILLCLGRALSTQHKKQEAFECCRKVLAINPDCAEAIYNMAFLQLRSGDYLSGFANFEARLAIEKFAIDLRCYAQPRWDGSPLNGRSILIYGEQGMGDVIQFARYVPLVAERGGKVIFEIDPQLVPLFATFPGIDRIVPLSGQPPLTDVYVQLLSLPHIFGTTMETVPRQIPYIIPDPAKVNVWRQRLGERTFLRVGLAWRGNPKNPRDKDRSCTLNTFAPLAGLADVEFYSLQVGAAAAEALAPPEGMPLTDMSPFLTDFTETAALIANLDLVIAVDTAVVHLAGAMGRPVWVLLPQGSEWRWLEGRDDTPWYPTMQVFEHKSENDWEGLMQRVWSALKTLLSEKVSAAGEMSLESRYEHGVRLKESGDLESAECCFRQIVEKHPDLPDPQHSLGVVLQLQGRLQEAVEHYQAAVRLDPCFAKAHFNLANACLRLARYQDALAAVKAALQCDPAYADAHWLHGMLLLQQGDYEHGWQEYEWRWQAAAFPCRIPDLGCPQWDGTALAGKVLLIHMEQGRGDMIQFIRYAPLAAAMGGEVIACVAPELISLIATVKGICQVVDRNGPLPCFDVHIPVQSLPYLFETTLETIPQNIPYFSVEPVKSADWRRIFSNEPNFRIGLVWQGDSAHKDDHNRSCPLNEFLLLGDIAGVDFYSLQFGTGAEQLHELPERLKVIDAAGQVRDFSDTAAIIAGLDLVISVDTAVAHLAGALGKTVWTLLPYVPEWRWLLERDDTPWYPSMRLFRQVSPGDWRDVFRRLKEDLERLLGHADLLNQLGINLLKSGAAARADQAFSRALTCDPANAESHCNRGVALDAMQRYEEAVVCYQEALYYKPDFINAMFNLGNTYMSLDRYEKARACYERAVELNPDFIAGHLCLGEVTKILRDFVSARVAFERAGHIDPGCADAFQGIAEVSQAEERYEEAIAAYHRALELKPGSTATLNLMGTAYQSIEQLEHAENCYRQALVLAPDQPTVLNNLAVVLNAQGRLEEAVAEYRHLLQVDPEYADGHWNLSVALLAMGAYAEGWQEFEWRFRKTDPVPTRHFPQPLWDGSDLQGRTVLLHAEQGFGDTFQFARYVPLVAKRGGIVIVECQVPALKRLLLTLEGAAQVVVAGEPLPPFDCHLPMMSLPLLFGTTVDSIPSSIPYLAAQPADVEVWRQYLGPRTVFRVGLVWYAKQTQVLNRKRSCHLREFAPLLAVPGVEFFTLQIGPGAEQLAECGAPFSLIKDFTGKITDFADTAAFVANLDLVITIDTAMAHLSGALGAKTWVILPYIAEWRWLLQREDSPWYPAMRLFRQPAAGDWPALLTSVAGALHDCVQAEAKPVNIEPFRSGLKVGLAWSGRQDNPLNRKRSCPFTVLAPLFDLPNVTFFSLQLDSPDGVDARLFDLTGQIRNFADTAALMANLDLIISIDTSVAHLAAALGRPTWVLLSHVADWRWLQNRTDSPWYPGIKLFRQPDHGDWEGVVCEVVDRLEKWSVNQLSEPLVKRQKPDSSVTPERLLLEQLLEEKRHDLQQHPDSPEAHLDVGAALALLGRDADAAISFRRVLELDPEHVAGHLNLAYALLALGEYPEGWRHFEWRLRRIPVGQLPPWPMLDPENFGKHKAGSSVLVHCEQGYGDTIQFARFLPLLAAAGYRVIVSCQPPIAPLLASTGHVSLVVAHGEPLPVCDLQVLLLSLPYLLAITLETLPAFIPYLAPDSALIDGWQTRLNNFICLRQEKN